jgi:hypothetical protein
MIIKGKKNIAVSFPAGPTIMISKPDPRVRPQFIEVAD